MPQYVFKYEVLSAMDECRRNFCQVRCTTVVGILLPETIFISLYFFSKITARYFCQVTYCSHCSYNSATTFFYGDRLPIKIFSNFLCNDTLAKGWHDAVCLRLYYTDDLQVYKLQKYQQICKKISKFHDIDEWGVL